MSTIIHINDTIPTAIIVPYAAISSTRSCLLFILLDYSYLMCRGISPNHHWCSSALLQIRLLAAYSCGISPHLKHTSSGWYSNCANGRILLVIRSSSYSDLKVICCTHGVRIKLTAAVEPFILKV